MMYDEIDDFEAMNRMESLVLLIGVALQFPLKMHELNDATQPKPRVKGQHNDFAAAKTADERKPVPIQKKITDM